VSLLNRIQKSAVRLIASKRKIKKLFFDELENELLSFKDQGYLKQTGWINSFLEKSCIDEKNKPLPWVTYSFIDFIKDKLSGSVSVFEFGSGYSKLFYAQRAKLVVAVEHDKEWYEKIKGEMPYNVRLYYEELQYGGLYSQKAAEQNEKFDLIIVDGRDRVNCCYNSVASLSEKGVLVLDDSEREEYKDAVKFLFSNHFRKLDFWGISPGLFYNKCTSVFYKAHNILEI
jgi:protein-L-isoaspartate O-methyltransferase